MNIEGNIKVWTDEEKAYARLWADGPEGPLVLEASAPLAPIRRMVAAVFARRGMAVSGDDVGYKASVKRLGRKRALRRLAVMAPGAFGPGGLAPYLARRELGTRRARRLALAHAGRPVGPKPIGPAAPAIPALGPVRGSLAPAEALSRRPQAPSAAPPPAEDEGPTESLEEAPPEEEAAYSTTDEDGAQDDEEKGEEDLGADAAPPQMLAPIPKTAPPSGSALEKAGLLLEAARTSPAAEKRVRGIVVLAKKGDPRAKAALKTLVVAKKASGKTGAGSPAVVLRSLTGRASRSRPPAGSAAPRRSPWRLSFDVFSFWRRGVG